MSIDDIKLNIWLIFAQVDFWSGVRAKFGNYLSVNDVDEDPVTQWLQPYEDASVYFTLVAIGKSQKVK